MESFPEYLQQLRAHHTLLPGCHRQNRYFGHLLTAGRTWRPRRTQAGTLKKTGRGLWCTGEGDDAGGRLPG